MSLISDETDVKFAKYLTKKVGVAVIPLSPFYESRKSQSLIRLCFAKSNEVLLEAASRLKKV